MFCDQCRARLEPGDVFCVNCGAANTHQSVETPMTPVVEEPIVASTSTLPIATDDDVEVSTVPAMTAADESSMPDHCSNCGAEQEPNTTFCTNCGSLTDTALGVTASTEISLDVSVTEPATSATASVAPTTDTPTMRRFRRIATGAEPPWRATRSFVQNAVRTPTRWSRGPRLVRPHLVSIRAQHEHFVASVVTLSKPTQRSARTVGRPRCRSKERQVVRTRHPRRSSIASG